MENELKRCGWAKSDLEKEYHDNVWGKPIHDDHALFKKLILDGQQAGLSWSIILKKMDGLCAAYDDFNPCLLVHYDTDKIDALLHDDRIIRNRAKINEPCITPNAILYSARNLAPSIPFYGIM